MRSRFTKATATSVLVVLVLVSFTWLAGTRDAVALVVVGEDYGLRVSLAEALTPTDNLAPEDTQTSIMTVSNAGTSSLPVTLTGTVTRRWFGIGGGDLSDKLTIKLLDSSSNVLYEGLLSGMNNPISLGTLLAGQARDYTFMVHLSGDTPNKYQAASVTVRWTVRTPGS